MKRPEYLQKGSTIALSSPSFAPTIEPYKTRFEEAIKKFKQMGFNLIIGDTCYKSDGIGISTKSEDCAKELTEFYLNPKIDAIFSCGGGELMCETVGNIDFSKLKDAKPKWFIGYSDNSNFIFPLVTKCNTMALYGQMFCTFGQKWDQSIQDHFDILTGKTYFVDGYEFFEHPDNHNIQGPLDGFYATTPKVLTLYNDNNGFVKAEGTLIGGCLDVINNLAGTTLEDVKGFNSKHKDVIWVLEACDYSPMDIRRALWHLDKCGWFINAKAFVFGRPLTAFGQSLMGVNQYNAVTDVLGKYNVPIIMDADVGHIDPMVPLIIGADCTIQADKDNWSISYNC